ncbi:class I SAM-dependent methyltransferase [Oceanospirillum sediminis]|uniref:Methyltransferase n=1 Tax=Oceanospirillum sediminis TaxID=2760088 RepID=A0A839IPA4_9GAMM|nr:50S ribosomal protein L11 methyltransferase [Oceanospirillum sediminis]MBB1486086.1 methyltransferase [Oceanospirillum sediminis]
MSDTLNNELQKMLPEARVQATCLPGCEQIRLWLIDPEPVHRPFSPDEIAAIMYHTPYWGFCWGSGLALARYILSYPDQLAGKKVIDFGSGSGVVAIAAAMAGADVVACDIDPVSQRACRENALLNQVSISISDDLLALPEMSADLLIAADVLYDRTNLPWLDTFFRFAPDVWVADSRVKDFSHDRYSLTERMSAGTVPDMGEPGEFSDIRFYRSI